MTTRRTEPTRHPASQDQDPPDRSEVERALEAVIAAILPRGGSSEPGVRKRPGPGHKPARKLR